MNPIMLHPYTTVTSLTKTTVLILLLSSMTITPLPVVHPFQLSQSNIKRITTTTHSRNDAGYHHRNKPFVRLNNLSSSSSHRFKRAATSLNNNYGSIDSSSTTAADFSKMTSINDQPINCPHFGNCPGCSTQSSTTSIPTATSASRYFSSNSITSHSTPSSSYSTILPTATTSYRTSAKLVATPRSSTWSRDGCLFGLYARGTHNVVPIPQCPVHHPLINRAVDLLERATTKARTSCFDEESGEGDLRYVQCQVERERGRVVLTLVYNKESWKECQPGLSRLVKELKRLDREENGDGSLLWHSIWCHLNAGLGNNIFARGENRWLRLEGPEYFRELLPLVEGVDESETKQGLLHYVPMGFRQGNVEGFDVIAKYVAEKVPRGSKVCELYAGVGVLGLTALSVGYWRDVMEGVGDGETRGLTWLRCSDENPVNPRCFDRSVNTMPIEITGRQKRRSFNNKGGNNKKDKRNNKRYTDNRRRGNNNSMKDPEMTLEDLLSGKVTIDDTPPEAKITYMAASAAKALYEGQAMGANCLIVDPPRKGLDPDVLTTLCKPHNPNQPSVDDIDFLITKHRHLINLCNDVTTLIYVSCGFDSLARDCDKLLMSEGAGWRIESAKGFVLFPGSDHVETVVVFKRTLGGGRR